MMPRVFVGLLTVLVFVAGYGSRVWTERGHPVPPPPAALADEYARAKLPPADAKTKNAIDRAKLLADLEKLKPQIEAYRTQVDEIYEEFDREFAAILKPAQREKHTANQKRFADMQAKRKADAKPLSDDDIMRARDQPLTDVYWMVTVTPRLERLVKEYQLDTAQQTDTRTLLTLRRNKFIALLDGTPHPSVRLSRLAPMIDRVAGPAK